MRELEILKILYTNKEYVPISYFMDTFNVSKRTIQSAISYLVQIQDTHGFHLLQKRGKGYVLEIYDTLAFENLLSKWETTNTIPEITIENVVAYLITKQEYVTMDEMIMYFGVSKTLLKSVVKNCEMYLATYSLELERKAHYGIRISKDLVYRKEVMIDLYKNHNSILEVEVNMHIGNTFSKIEEILISFLKKEERIINYEELKTLTTWLRIVIYIHIQSKVTTPIYHTQPVCKAIEESFSIFFTSKEVMEFVTLIEKTTRKYDVQTEYLSDITFLINDFLTTIDAQNQTHFNTDKEFKQLLIAHITSLIDRSHFEMTYKNPIIDELTIKYPMIFNIVIALSEALQERFHITIDKSEIGFIVTHFAVHMEKEIGYRFSKYSHIGIVCSTGGGSSYLIQLKIQKLFPDANIKTFSLLQMDELQNYQPDIVFSISPLPITLNVPLIYIKELLDDYDILKIKQLLMFDDVKQGSIKNEQETFLAHFLDSELFTIKDEIMDYLECLKEMAIIMEEKGIGGYGYSEMVLKREAFSSTIYLNNIAIAHPLEMQAKRNKIAVCILRKPFTYQARNVQVIFMVALSKESLPLHKEITSHLFDIMNDYSLVQEIIKVQAFEELIALLNRKR